MFSRVLAVVFVSSLASPVIAACGGDNPSGSHVRGDTDGFVVPDVPVLIPDAVVADDAETSDDPDSAPMPDLNTADTPADALVDVAIDADDVGTPQPDTGDVNENDDVVGDIGRWGELVGGTWVVAPEGQLCDVFVPGTWTIDVAPGPRITANLGGLALATCTVDEHDSETDLLSLSCGATVDGFDDGTIGIGAFIVIQGDSALVELTLATRSFETVVTCQDMADFTMSRTR